MMSIENSVMPEEFKINMYKKKLSRGVTAAEKSVLDKEFKINKKPYKIFISSPGDVKFLRLAANNVINNINETHEKANKEKPFVSFMWEKNMNAGFYTNIQEEIFNKFGDSCNIFILILWTTLGAGGTEKEYKKFIDKYKGQNCELFVCWYAGDITLHPNNAIKPQDLNFKQLQNFVKLDIFYTKNKSKWLELGIDRASITSEQIYKDELRNALYTYLLKYKND
jgi:hypothetical protein